MQPELSPRAAGAEAASDDQAPWDRWLGIFECGSYISFLLLKNILKMGAGNQLPWEFS